MRIYTPSGSSWVQSVDILSEIVSDPFLLGEIATVHALSISTHHFPSQCFH